MKLPSLIEEALEQCGRPWRIEQGTKHLKIYVNHRLAGVVPHHTRDADRRASKNVRSQIRRVAALNEQATIIN